MLTEDFLFYWLHRLSHTKLVYHYVHKQHHEFNHTVSYAAAYCKWPEYLFGNLLPAVAGAKFLANRMHLATYLMWMTFRVFESLDGHCGYEFPWSPYRLIPFSGSADFHNFHHEKNVGNYGSIFNIWDSICGTNSSYFKDKDK